MTLQAGTSRRRSAGSPRGTRRREALLAAVVDDLAENGLADVSLRRAARAAGTTHKVLLYHFDSLEALLAEALRLLRAQRVENVMPVALAQPTLAKRVKAIWPVLMRDDSGLRVIDQAIGLAMYDPERYAHLARDATEAYLPFIASLCPSDWDKARTAQVTQLILATMRGFLMEWRTVADKKRIDAGLAALVRALEAEESRRV